MSTVACPYCKHQVSRRGLGGSKRCRAAASRLQVSASGLERLEELADDASEEPEAIPVHHRPVTASSLSDDASTVVLGVELDSTERVDEYRSDPEHAAPTGPRPKLQARRPKAPRSAPAAVTRQTFKRWFYPSSPSAVSGAPQGQGASSTVALQADIFDQRHPG